MGDSVKCLGSSTFLYRISCQLIILTFRLGLLTRVFSLKNIISLKSLVENFTESYKDRYGSIEEKRGYTFAVCNLTGKILVVIESLIMAEWLLYDG